MTLWKTRFQRFHSISIVLRGKWKFLCSQLIFDLDPVFDAVHVLCLCCQHSPQHEKSCYCKHLLLSVLFFPWPSCTTYGILVPWTGIKPKPSAMKLRTPNQWTSRKFPFATLLMRILFEASSVSIVGRPKCSRKSVCPVSNSQFHGLSFHCLCVVVATILTDCLWLLPFLISLP